VKYNKTFDQQHKCRETARTYISCIQYGKKATKDGNYSSPQKQGAAKI
jgi:hypothetical protein